MGGFAVLYGGGYGGSGGRSGDDEGLEGLEREGVDWKLDC